MNLKYYDYLVLASILLLWVGQAATNIAVGIYTGEAETQAQVQAAEAFIQVAEANPIARYFLATLQLQFIFSLVIVPGLILGTYVAMRRRTRTEPYGAENVAWIFFFVAATDALNDVSIVLGLMI